MHKPIQIKNTIITPGSRLAIIGRNGSGKTTLLKSIRDQLDCAVGYVPQTIEQYDRLSGGERFNKALSEALANDPDVLLLDEPTNHLDRKNRRSLMRMLQGYRGTLVVVSHDRELLRHSVETLWHLDQGEIHVFTGYYDDYMRELEQRRSSIERHLTRLEREKRGMHNVLMKEQKRAAKSKKKGQKSIENKKWPTIVSRAKADRAEQTSGKKKAAIDRRKQELVGELEALRLPEVIVPTFSLSAEEMGNREVLSIREGAVGYGDTVVTEGINLSLRAGSSLAIKGNNGSGKSTILKAILGAKEVTRSGEWRAPSEIGYLDQHYSNLMPGKRVIEMLDSRALLSTFLFQSNEEVNRLVEHLSGGERVRLSLALIAATTPRLLILDEVTNNLDIETKEHVIQVLRGYPGAMVVVSHEEDFLEAIGIDEVYEIRL